MKFKPYFTSVDAALGCNYSFQPRYHWLLLKIEPGITIFTIIPNFALREIQKNAPIHNNNYNNLFVLILVSKPEPMTAANLEAMAPKCMITIKIHRLQVIYVFTVDEDLKFSSSREMQHGLSPPPPPTSHVRVPPHQGVDNKDKISGVSRRGKKD